MLRKLILIPLFTVLIAVACGRSNFNSAQDKAALANESKEPPVKYVLKMGDQEIAIQEGKAVQLKGTFTDPEITLTAEPHRVFPYQGISFKYPRAFTFEADLGDETYKNWTLSGNDFKIMYFVMEDPLTPEAFSDNLVSEFGEENCTVEKASPLPFGSKKLSGITLHASIVGNPIVMDIYAIPHSDRRTRLLVLQDNIDDVGERSAEGRSTLRLIEESSQLQP